MTWSDISTLGAVGGEWSKVPSEALLLKGSVLASIYSAWEKEAAGYAEWVKSRVEYGSRVCMVRINWRVDGRYTRGEDNVSYSGHAQT